MIPIILASASPRRRDLMAQVGLQVDVRAPEVNEDVIRGEKPADMVKRLARDKARALVGPALESYEESLIIAADTTVVSPSGKIFGKPGDKAEAVKMLRAISGKTHTVLTAYCVLKAKRGEARHKEHVRVVKSLVTMRALPLADIERYVASGEPMDKAGSYAAQGLGMALIEKITGSYTNVVGLPISQLLNDLETRFELPLFSWTPGNQ